MMEHSQTATNLIMSFEGYHTALKDGSCQAYLDTNVRPAKYSRGYKGLWTIGWGNTGRGITQGTVWSRKRAVDELNKMIARHAAVVNKLVKVPLTQNQFDALVSLSYNLGLENAKTLLRKLNAGDYTGAADAFLLYNKGGGRVLPGLVRRRKAERKLFLSKATPPTVVQASRKLTVIQRTRQSIAGLGVTAATISQYVGDSWQWVQNNPQTVAIIAFGGATVLWLILKWVEKSSVQDYEEGRYVPSRYND